MKEYIRHRLRESIISNPLRLPKNIEITEADKNIIKNISWEELNVIDNGSSGNIFHFNIEIPNVNDEINQNLMVDIQVIRNILYQMHINIPNTVQNMGLGYKIYLTMINYLGQVYSGKGRRHNEYVNNIWSKLKNEPSIDCYSNELGDICFSKQVPDDEKNQILNTLNFNSNKIS